MYEISVLVLHPSEAKQILVDYYTNVLVNDRKNTRNFIETGTLLAFVPSFTNMSDAKVAELFGHLNLGQPLAKSIKIGQVVIEVDGNYTIVFDIENLHPESRWPVGSKTPHIGPDEISDVVSQKEEPTFDYKNNTNNTKDGYPPNSVWRGWITQDVQVPHEPRSERLELEMEEFDNTKDGYPPNSVWRGWNGGRDEVPF